MHDYFFAEYRAFILVQLLPWNPCSHTFKTCGDHFTKIIEPLSYLNCRVVSALVINDKALMYSFLFVHLHYARSLLTRKLKVNILRSHFVWSPENQNMPTIWCLDLDKVKRLGQKVLYMHTNMY